jgi:hypothetical protein
MADQKISALTAATTPLAGTEVLPIVQSGTTKKVAISQATVFPIGTTKFIGQTAPVAHQAANAGSVGIGVDDGGGAPSGVFIINSFNGVYSEQKVVVRTALGGVSATTDQLDIQADGNVAVKTGNLVIGTSGKGIDFSATPGTGTSELLADYEEGTWTPVVSGVTLSTPLGTYTKIGNKVYANFNFGSTGAVSSDPFLISGLPFTPNTNATEADRPAGYLTFNGSAVKLWTLLFGSGVTTVAFRQDPGGTTGTITDLSGLTLWGTIIYTSV